MSELTMSYYSWLSTLSLESLEIRRVRADLILVYKIVFGLLSVTSEAFFTPIGLSHNCVDIHIH